MNYKASSQKFNNFLINIQNDFSKQTNRVLFEQRNIIKLIDYNEKKYVVKSFKIPHLLNQVVYRFFRASKAQRSYENSVRLKELGVNTPKPIGYIEFPSLFLFQESYYVSEFFDYDFEIRAVLADSTFQDREAILKAFVAFSHNLHNKGVYHIDYSPGNVLIKKSEDGYVFSIIDVNRMKFIVYDDEMRFKNLSRFSTSDTDLNFIAREYARLADLDEKFALDTLRKYHNEHQQYLVNKKRLKSLKKKK